MGKSIRSKIKRVHRSEFRATIGGDAYKSNLEKVQAKMKEYVEKQSLSSIEKLSEQLVPSNDNDDENSVMDEGFGQHVDVNAAESKGEVDYLQNRGENKVIVNKKHGRKRKHSYRMKAIERKKKDIINEKQPPKKHRYHCEF